VKDIVVFREPKLKPLPPSITREQMQGAQLPVRLERARQAIAECYDLSELLTWKDQAAAICAAAKASKMPELAKGANRVCKEALLRLGQLLSSYKSGHPGRGNKTKSPRSEAALAAGVSLQAVSTAVKLAQSPQNVRDTVLSDDSVTVSKVPRKLARLYPKNRSNHRSDAYTSVMGGGLQGKGFNQAMLNLRRIDLADVQALAPDEKKMVRAKVTEAMERLDAIEEALK
jgi:hypothetical protein